MGRECRAHGQVCGSKAEEVGRHELFQFARLIPQRSPHRRQQNDRKHREQEEAAPELPHRHRRRRVQPFERRLRRETGGIEIDKVLCRVEVRPAGSSESQKRLDEGEEDIVWCWKGLQAATEESSALA